METSIVSSASLAAGLAAVQQAQYQEAIGILEAFCHDCAVQAQVASREYLQARMHLVNTYEHYGQIDRAKALCSQLLTCSNAQVQIWAKQRLQTLDRLRALDQLDSDQVTADSDAPTVADTACLNRLRQLFQDWFQ